MTLEYAECSKETKKKKQHKGIPYIFSSKINLRTLNYEDENGNYLCRSISFSLKRIGSFFAKKNKFQIKKLQLIFAYEWY